MSIYTLPEEGKLWTECKTGDITDCISYEYEKFFNGVGTFTMELPINTRFGGRIGKNTVLVTDGGDELIVKNIKTTADKITLTGYDLNGILLDRVTLYSGSGGTDNFDPFEGSTEACVKHYVACNFVSSAVAERNLPRFGVAENTLNRGVADDHAMPRLEVVADIVTDMCGSAGLGWRVSINRSAGLTGDIFVFDVAEQVDRTVNQSERNRVIFSIQQHNVSEMTREVGITAAKNVLYCDIGGTVVQYPQAGSTEGRTAGVGYSRREEYCALSGNSLDPEKYGVEAEQNMCDRMEETDSLVIDAGSPLDYGVLYDVGTIATAYDRERSLQLDSVISSVAVKRSGSEYSVKLSLGNSKPKLLCRCYTLGCSPREDNHKAYREKALSRAGGAFSARENAENYAKKVRAAGFGAMVVTVGKLYRVQTGAFSSKINADNYAKSVRKAGFGAFVVEV